MTSCAGSQIFVYGTLSNTSGSSSFALDNGKYPVEFHPQMTAEQSLDHRVLLYTSPSLDNSTHTLNVSLVQDGGTLNLDYIQINQISSSSLPGNSSHISGLSSGVIAGIAIASIFFLLGIVALVATVYKIQWYNNRRLMPSNEGDFGILEDGASTFRSVEAPIAHA